MSGDLLWLVMLCFTLATALAFGLLIWGASSLVLHLRERWRRSVWETAARMLAERPREVENFVASQTMDAVEYREYELRPDEVTDYERLNQLTREEAIDGMLAHTAEGIRLAVTVTALVNEVAELKRALAAKERARARHLATAKRLRKQLSPSDLGDAVPNHPLRSGDK